MYHSVEKGGMIRRVPLQPMVSAPRLILSTYHTIHGFFLSPQILLSAFHVFMFKPGTVPVWASLYVPLFLLFLCTFFEMSLFLVVGSRWYCTGRTDRITSL